MNGAEINQQHIFETTTESRDLAHSEARGGGDN